MRKVTIEDISRETGLSRGTVSRALNDRPDISQKTKRVVVDACTKLNYVPSHAARALATGRHLAIAVVAAAWASPGTLAMLRGVMQAADKARLAVQVIAIPSGEADALRRVSALGAERIDGVVVGAPLSAAQSKLLAETLSERVVVSVYRLPGVHCDVIVADRREAGRLAARHLAARGIRDALFLCRAGDDDATVQHEAFCETLRASGAADGLCRKAVVLPSDLAQQTDAIRAAAAIVATDDVLAIAAALIATGRGRRVGRELPIIGYGNHPISAEISPGLSSIDPHCGEIGTRAAQFLVQRLEQKRMDAPQTVEVAPTFVERESTSAV